MGAGPPVISPGVNLPGAEFFALGPNRSIALGPRLASGQTFGPFTVTAGGTVTGPQLFINVDPNWSYGSGLYLVRSYATFTPADNTGELQITSARMGLGQSGGAIFLDMGIPTATLANPAGGAIVVIYERDALVTQLDFPTFPVNTPLFLDFQVNCKNNDPTNPHSATVGVNAVWHRINGFVQ